MADAERLAYVHLGLTPVAFKAMTIRELNMMAEGHAERDRARGEELYILASAIRWNGTLLHNANVKKFNQKRPEQLFPLWLDKREKKKVTREETMDYFKRLGDI